MFVIDQKIVTFLINIYYRTDNGKYYELNTALPGVRRTSGMLSVSNEVAKAII